MSSKGNALIDPLKEYIAQVNLDYSTSLFYADYLHRFSWGKTIIMVASFSITGKESD